MNKHSAPYKQSASPSLVKREPSKHALNKPTHSSEVEHLPQAAEAGGHRGVTLGSVQVRSLTEVNWMLPQSSQLTCAWSRRSSPGDSSLPESSRSSNRRTPLAEAEASGDYSATGGGGGKQQYGDLPQVAVPAGGKRVRDHRARYNTPNMGTTQNIFDSNQLSLRMF